MLIESPDFDINKNFFFKSMLLNDATFFGMVDLPTNINLKTAKLLTLDHFIEDFPKLLHFCSGKC